MATIKLLPGVKQSFQQDESLNSSNRRTLPSSCSLSSRQQERIARISTWLLQQRQASTSAASCFVWGGPRLALSQSDRCTMWHGTVRRQRVLVTTEEKNRIMRACHDGVDGSHFGRDKTLSKVSNKKDSVHKDVINVINPTVIFTGVTVILLEVNGKGCSRVLQMLRCYCTLRFKPESDETSLFELYWEWENDTIPFRPGEA